MSYSKIFSINSRLNFDEHQWVNLICEILEEKEAEQEEDHPVYIFNVPKSLMATDPMHYIPQEVAIGPYHHWRQELYEMERYKLAAARRLQKQLQSFKLENLVDELMKFELRIRACYHKYIDLCGKTLAWMIAVDASFVLEFLQVINVIQKGDMEVKVSSRMSHSLDYAGNKASYNAMLRDLVMLENQIPLFVIKKQLELKFSSQESADNMLLSLLMGLHEEVSPFKMMQDVPYGQLTNCSHLLDFLYQLTVPKFEEKLQAEEITIEVEIVQEGIEEGDVQKPSETSKWYVRQFHCVIGMLLSKINPAPLYKLIIKMPLKIISRLPLVKIIKQPALSFFGFFQAQGDKKLEDENPNKPPLVEEIGIPSVRSLLQSGVRFAATNGNIATVRFEAKTCTLYLPRISLDVNSEVLMRNLVAYEASTESGPMVFTRYTELMNGIIDTEEDARLLRERNIIVSHLKDGEVANLWNGMRKSIRLTKVPFLDKTIEEVNKYHNNRPYVKVGKFVKYYVYGSWRVLALLAALLLLLLMAMQSFCSIYTCSRFVRDFTSSSRIN